MHDGSFPHRKSMSLCRSRGSGGCSPPSSYHIIKLNIINSTAIAFFVSPPHTLSSLFVLHLYQFLPLEGASKAAPKNRRPMSEGQRKAATITMPLSVSLNLTDSNSPFVCLFNQSASPFLLFCSAFAVRPVPAASTEWLSVCSQYCQVVGAQVRQIWLELFIKTLKILNLPDFEGQNSPVLTKSSDKNRHLATLSVRRCRCASCKDEQCEDGTWVNNWSRNLQFSHPVLVSSQRRFKLHILESLLRQFFKSIGLLNKIL